ncbi:MAG: hypothetical protein ACREQA_18430 [Candidatus Binatia bacterium]
MSRTETEHNGFVIEGDEKFIEQTGAALDLLEKKSHTGYQLAKDFIGRIKKTDKRSGMGNFENPPTFYVNELTAHAGLEWYASCIVHDANHAREHREYVRKHPVLGPMLRFAQNFFHIGWQEAEKRCLETQYSTLLDLGERSLADYVRSLDGTHFRNRGIW